jgi:hypothetical protein
MLIHHTQGIMGYAITVAGVVLYSEAKRHSKADNQGAGKGSPVKGVPSALGTMQPSPLPTVSAACTQQMNPMALHVQCVFYTSHTTCLPAPAAGASFYHQG